MEYRKMEQNDLAQVASFYVDYYNRCEDGMWTEETAKKRIRQVLTREDSYCLLLENNSELVGFAMGYFEQYDDGFTYDLIEIVIAADYQNNGIGTAFMQELEHRVRKAGAMLLRLDAINDAHHEHFYSKLGYKNVRNFVMKTKML